MAKMIENEASVGDFLASIEGEAKRADSQALLKIFEEVTGYQGKMWGDRILGFGKYHYKYASGHSGQAPYVGFAPGKSGRISLYIMVPGDQELEALLDRMGKHKRSKGCVYINKLGDVDQEVLRRAIKRSLEIMKEAYPEG